MSKPNKLKKWLWVAAIGTVLVIWIPISKIKDMLKRENVTDSTNTTIIAPDPSEIDSLKSIIELYKEDQQDLNNTIAKLNRQVSDLKSSINNRESVIKQLKQGTNEKVSNVNNFTNSDIYKLLSDRYKDSTAVK